MLGTKDLIDMCSTSGSRLYADSITWMVARPRCRPMHEEYLCPSEHATSETVDEQASIKAMNPLAVAAHRPRVMAIVRTEKMMKMRNCFPLIGATLWIGAVGGILISVAVIRWSEMGDTCPVGGDGHPLGLLVLWGRILVACNLLAILIAFAGIAATWQGIRANTPCGRVLVGTAIALLMPLVCTILILLK